MENIKGFKVTDSNMSCRGHVFELNKQYSVEGVVKACKNGYHFCKNLIDCFNYYGFNPSNRVFEILASGDTSEEDDKIASRSITLIKELTWYEVLNLVNTGKGNSGNRNSGDYNSGNRNSGDYNSGNRNSGNRNSGNRNSGNRNSGDYNSGNRNSGNRNSGDYNSGDYNSGDYNSGDYNSGFFNNTDSTIRLFNKDTGLYRNDINIPYINLPLNTWVSDNDMSDEEKIQHPKFYITKGYLKTLSYKESWDKAWSEMSNSDKQQFKNLPNFDAEVFEDITGIKII